MPASPAVQARADGRTDKCHDAIIIGAGIAGMYQLYRLRELGLSVRVFETGSGVGGTWYWNRYPGARFDSESYTYGYSFSDELLQEWRWSEHFAPQPETLRYLNHVADRFDLRRDIQFNSRVVAAHFDEAAERWEVTLEDGGRSAARFFLITALGPLSAATLPRIQGVESFRGQSFHTYCWPHEFEELRTRVEKIKLGVASRRAKRFLDDMAFLKRDSAEKFRRLAHQVRRLEAEDGPGLPEAAPRGRGKEQTT